jgi:hypothetical protein
MKCDLERKLKRERVEVCLNCKRFVNCDDIGKFEDCADFEEVEVEAWVIKNLDDLCEYREHCGE